MKPHSNLSPEPKYSTLDTGLQLEYIEQHPGGNVAAVFLHGVTDSCRSFEPVFPYLPPSLRALAISQRGHGGSDHPESGYSYRHFSKDVRGFLDALAIPRAWIVGHSMGSMVAQRFAVDHPERVVGLVLVG